MESIWFRTHLFLHENFSTQRDVQDQYLGDFILLFSTPEWKSSFIWMTEGRNYIDMACIHVTWPRNTLSLSSQLWCRNPFATPHFPSIWTCQESLLQSPYSRWKGNVTRSAVFAQGTVPKHLNLVNFFAQRKMIASCFSVVSWVTACNN